MTFYLMRAFRYSAKNAADAQSRALSQMMGCEGDVSFHFECPPYWPWKEGVFGVRVKAYVYAPEGTILKLDEAGGAPLLHLPDGKEPLTGAAVLQMSPEALSERGLRLQIIS